MTAAPSGSSASRPQVPPNGTGRLSLTALPGVGARMAARLETLGLASVEDLLGHLPLRYQDRTRTAPLGDLVEGKERLVEGRIDLARVRPGRRPSLEITLGDDAGRLWLRFFHFSRGHRERLIPGARVSAFGEVRRGPEGLEMVHPEWRILAPGEPPPIEEHLTAVYPTTEGLGQATLRRLVDQALGLLGGGQVLPEPLPAELRRRLGLPHLAEALRLAHHPPSGEAEGAAAAARGRLAFEELLAHHLALRSLRTRLDQRRAPSLAGGGALEERFRRTLPFRLTNAQERVAAEIAADLSAPRPMHRLLQGDVGSGKTVVSALAALRAVAGGRQVALMAPTELLAEQHLASFRAWMEPLGVDLAWLSGRQPAAERRAALAAVAEGRAGLVVGTHALFQQPVEFANLGLVIVDEQHRFGVHQRLALTAKGAAGTHPHQLVMTATPIPRTLAMTAYADLDTSVIDELPPGRTAVATAVMPASRRAEVVARIHQLCRTGQQVYWVCTLIEESEALKAEAAADTAARLATALDGVRVGLVHGRLPAASKEAVMRGFRSGEIDLLVATTVIEVGVDVPNASLMVVENAERLGLAQLHQLRGRVGRGQARSACLLLYNGPLSDTARARLHTLRDTNDGFRIAERDLELRGPGEVLGTRQAGLGQLRYAELPRDGGLLSRVAQAAAELTRGPPGVAEALVRRWVDDGLHYAAV